MQETRTEFTICGLKKSFRKTGQPPLLVLGGIDFDVESGEFLTILGPSGCGKTTILKIIAGIEKMDGGSITPTPDITGPLPIVWQENRLFPWRTVMRNVSFPLELLTDIDQHEADEKARRILREMGLGDFGDYYPWQISGGMAERVAIGRALITDPSYLLMDEPFASVDYQTKLALFRQVQELRKEHRLTIIYVTHDLRDAIQFSDRIVVLSKLPTKVREIVPNQPANLPHSQMEEHLLSLLG